jgi:eukaryotic-like serine/threonine-protein kinase
MAPEYLREGHCDAASDVFSLAGTLIHAATGRGPFGDGTGVDVMHRVAFEDPDPEVMAELAAGSPDLAGLLSACPSNAPAERPAPQQLVDAAVVADTTPARVWPEPLHGRLLERERACEVLRNTPAATTRPLTAPSGGVPPAPAADAYRPHAPPGRYGPRGPADGAYGDAGAAMDEEAAMGDGAIGPGQPRPRAIRLAVVAAVAVCAVVLSAFWLTRPDADLGPAADAAPTAGPTAPETAGEATLSGGAASRSPAAEEERDGDGDGKDGSPAGPEPGGDGSGTQDDSSAPGAPGGDGAAGRDGSGEEPEPTTGPTADPTEQAAPPWISRCTYYSGTRLTRYGDTGQRVVQVQCMLTERGHGVGDAGVDGQFGDGTLAAVKRFQSAAGLTVDGDVGPHTWSALRSRS